MDKDETEPTPPGRRIAELEARLAEQAREIERLNDLLAHYQTLAEAAQDHIFLVGPDLRVRYSNPYAAASLKLKPHQVIGKHIRELFPPEAYQAIEENLNEVFRSGQPISKEEKILFAGKTLWLYTHLTPVREGGRVSAVLGRCHDITARRRVEEALRASEASYRTIFNAVSDAIFVHHPHTGAILDVNERVRDLYGYEPEELKGRPAGVLSLGKAPYDQDHAVERVRRAAGGEPQLFEWHARRKDGRTIWVEVALRAVTLNNNPRVIAVVRDITERKRAEEALRLSEQRYRTTLDSLGDAVHVVDRDLRIILYNKTFKQWCQRLGFPAELRGRTVMEMFPFLPERVREEYERVFATGESIITEEKIQISGQEYITLASKAPIEHAGQVVAVITAVRDITEERRLQDEALKAQKLEALSLVAGAIAHDFSNLLAGVLTNLESVRAAAPEPLRERLGEAIGAARRASALARRLLPFSKGWSLQKQSVRLEPLLSETARLALVGSRTRCQCRFPDDLWPVLADPDHLGQVFQNLLINARQAMDDAGTVEVSAHNVAVPEGAPMPIPPGRYVRVEVHDHGVGIPPENLPRIFDHYFTTREGGTGLGLAGTYQIVKKHGGHIEADSEVGLGTTFRLFLPAAPAQTPPEFVVAEPPAPYGQLRILLMDDEEFIRRGARRLLEGDGHTVECAADGAEAIELFQKARDRRQPFHLAVLDVTVAKGMGGIECLEKLRQLDPHLPVILSTGHLEDTQSGQWEALGPNALLRKPYSQEQLNDALAKALGG